MYVEYRQWSGEEAIVELIYRTRTTTVKIGFNVRSKKWAYKLYWLRNLAKCVSDTKQTVISYTFPVYNQTTPN